MKEYKIFILICLLFLLTGCSNMPIKDGELAIGANTSATMDDVGVAKIKREF